MPHQNSNRLPLVYAQAAFHLLEGDAAEAQELFERLYRLHGSSVHAMFAAMAADMAGDRQACARILQSIAGRRTRTHHLAELLLPEVDGEDTTKTPTAMRMVPKASFKMSNLKPRPFVV